VESAQANTLCKKKSKPVYGLTKKQTTIKINNKCLAEEEGSQEAKLKKDSFTRVVPGTRARSMTMTRLAVQMA